MEIILKVLLTCTLIFHCVMEPLWALPTPFTTDGLVRVSKLQQMLQYLNKTVDPCDNFYEFACGNYAQYHPATKERPGTHVLTFAREDMERKISDLLNDKVKDSTNHLNEEDAAVWHKVQNFYKSCNNANTQLSETYAQKLKDIIAEFGQMPVLQGANWQEKEFDWLQIVAEIAHKYDIYILLGFYTFNDAVDNVKNRLHFGHQAFGFGSSEIIFGPEHAIHRQQMKHKIAITLMRALNLPPEVAVDTAQEIFDLEITLAKGLGKFSPTESDPIRRHDSADDLNEIYSYFGLDTNRMLAIWLGFMPQNLSDIELIEVNPFYQLKTISILRETPKRVIANYIFYKLISRFTLPEQKYCEAATITHFSKFLTHKVYHYYNMSQSAEYIQNLFQHLKSTFRTFLESENYLWISDKTRKLAVEKLEAMQLIIRSYDNVNFTMEYAALNPNPYDLIENLKSLYQLKAMKSRYLFDHPPKYFQDEIDFGFSPAYVLPDNIIRFPLSNLLPFHLFSLAYPQAVNMGVLGFLVGHEIIHGFDDHGREIDINGALNDWWDEDSAEEYKRRTDCFVQQYHQYTYEGYQLPKRQVQSENIADNGGIKLAYAAYLDWYERALKANHNMQLESFPNIEYSHKQLFFISVAQSWCRDVLAELRLAQLLSDSHMPDSIRVVGALSNFREFSIAFNCPRGSGMNPNEKCEIF